MHTVLSVPVQGDPCLVCVGQNSCCMAQSCRLLRIDGSQPPKHVWLTRGTARRKTLGVEEEEICLGWWCLASACRLLRVSRGTELPLSLAPANCAAAVSSSGRVRALQGMLAVGCGASCDVRAGGWLPPEPPMKRETPGCVWGPALGVCSSLRAVRARIRSAVALPNFLGCFLRDGRREPSPSVAKGRKGKQLGSASGLNPAVTAPYFVSGSRHAYGGEHRPRL